MVDALHGFRHRRLASAARRAGDFFNHPEALVHVDGHLLGWADRHVHTIALEAALAEGASHSLALIPDGDSDAGPMIDGRTLFYFGNVPAYDSRTGKQRQT